MTAVLKILANAYNNRPIEGGPCYVKSMDFEARRGRGELVPTSRKDEAMVFENSREALRFWQTQSKSRPFRPDGKPNRPLTAYTVEIVTTTP